MKKLAGNPVINDEEQLEIISLLYKLVLGREPDPDGIKYWLSQTSQKPLEEIFWAFLNSEEFKIHCDKSPLFNHIISMFKEDNSDGNLLDALNILKYEDDWKKYEEIIVNQQKQARNNPELDYFLKSIYLDENRDASFERFLKSNDFYYTKHILEILGLKKNSHAVEIGAGAGYLTWSLYKSSFNIDYFDNNDSFVMGSGYLKSLNTKIKIFNDIHEWYHDPIKYDAIITKNTIHHFRNITYVASCIKRKLNKGGRWYAFREWFANSADELAAKLKSHPYAETYNMYEWAYPAATYVESIQMAGFKLKEVIPADYADNAIGTYNEQPIKNNVFTVEFDKLLKSYPGATTKKFWNEHYAIKAGAILQPQYTIPQLMVFEK